MDIIKEALRYIGSSATSHEGKRLRQGICQCLIKLARNTAHNRKLREYMFVSIMRSFIDRSVRAVSERPDNIPPHPTEAEVCVMELYLPIIDVVLRSPAFEPQGRSSDDTVSLFRNFWFLMIVRGYVSHPDCISKFDSIYTHIAVATPMLVLSSSTNYLEAEIDTNTVIKQVAQDASQHNLLRQKLLSIVPAQGALIKSLGIPQIVFLLAIYYIETARAR
ncbi:phosphatidylinositol-4- kinase, partial [Spiromyces aspiralis]